MSTFNSDKQVFYYIGAVEAVNLKNAIDTVSIIRAQDELSIYGEFDPGSG